MPGTIKLVRKFGPERKAKHSAYYFDGQDIKNTVERWRKMHKEKFENYYVHAIPQINVRRV